MEILEAYSFRLWRSYHRTALDARLRYKKKLVSENAFIKLAKMLHQTKRLCQFVDLQIEQWRDGVYTSWPIDPHREFIPDCRLVFSLEYPHMHPEIQRFMDWAGLEYSLYGHT